MLPCTQFAHNSSIPFCKTPWGVYLSAFTYISDYPLVNFFLSQTAVSAYSVYPGFACRKHSREKPGSTH